MATKKTEEIKVNEDTGRPLEYTPIPVEPSVKLNGACKSKAEECLPQEFKRNHLEVLDLPTDEKGVLNGGFRRDLVNKVNYCRHDVTKVKLLKETLLVAIKRLDEKLCDKQENKGE